MSEPETESEASGGRGRALGSGAWREWKQNIAVLDGTAIDDGEQT